MVIRTLDLDPVLDPRQHRAKMLAPDPQVKPMRTQHTVRDADENLKTLAPSAATRQGGSQS